MFRSFLSACLASIFLLTTAPASAARVERTIENLPYNARLVWDTTKNELIYEIGQQDVLYLNKHGIDGLRLLGLRMYEEFDEGDGKGMELLQSDGTAFDGSTGIYNLLFFPRGNKFAVFALGAGQTLAPDMDAAGLDIGGDQTDDEGYEIISHGLGASGGPLVIGTTPAFTFEVGITVADVSGSDDLHCGLRQLEAHNAAFDNYTDLVSLGWNTAAATAAIKIETILGNAATVSTDTTETLADATATNWEFHVSAAGVVTYEIDGAAPSTTASYTFADGLGVVPFCWFLNATAAQVGSVHIDMWEVRLQADQAHHG